MPDAIASLPGAAHHSPGLPQYGLVNHLSVEREHADANPFADPDPNTVDWYTQQRQTDRDLYRVLKPFTQRFEVGHPTKGQSSYASPDARHDARRS